MSMGFLGWVEINKAGMQDLIYQLGLWIMIWIFYTT